MTAKTLKLLCVSPSATQRAIIAKLASERGCQAILCSGEEEAQGCLEQETNLALMVVANELAEGDSFQLIESVRLSLTHATLPIAFITGNSERSLAANALHAGATEVFSRDDFAALGDFIAECIRRAEAEVLHGVVMLVEDSESHGEYVSHLCRQLGMEVEVFRDVATAEAAYRQGKYLLAVIDVVLNDLRTGISLVRTIRQNHQDHQPILMMSGYGDVSRRLMALKSGADDFISKPFTPEEFVWRVKKVLKSQAAMDRFDDAPAGESATEQLMARLSPREREICALILSGVADKEIVRVLGISFWTVRSHIEQIFNKTGAVNRRDLMARFIGQNK